MYKRNQAKHLLQHYMALLARKAGAQWDSDNLSEIDELVDCLIDAAKEEIKAETIAVEGVPVLPDREAYSL